MAEVKPIRTKKDHKAAMLRLEEIWPDGQRFESQALADEFEILTILIEQFELTAYPVPTPTPIEAIRAKMDAHGLNNSQLAEKMGVSVARAGEVLAGKRQLSINMIRSLVSNLDMDGAVLIGSGPVAA